LGCGNSWLLPEVNQRIIFDDGRHAYERANVLINYVAEHYNPDLVLAFLNNIASQPAAAYILMDDWQGGHRFRFSFWDAC
jgi:hypothetical protein